MATRRERRRERGRWCGGFSGQCELSARDNPEPAVAKGVLSLFRAGVSHEFKNPLASIRTATEMLTEVDEHAQQQRFLRMVEQEVARMESMLAGVCEITLIDAQLTNESRQRLDLCALLQRIVDGFRLRENLHVEVALELPPGPCEVDASEDRLIQVFVNVLENAISFSPKGGRVTM
jgi:two-component system, OmpR family, sensor histidine kinase ChvG